MIRYKQNKLCLNSIEISQITSLRPYHGWHGVNSQVWSSSQILTFWRRLTKTCKWTTKDSRSRSIKSEQKTSIFILSQGRNLLSSFTRSYMFTKRKFQKDIVVQVHWLKSPSDKLMTVLKNSRLWRRAMDHILAARRKRINSLRQKFSWTHLPP